MSILFGQVCEEGGSGCGGFLFHLGELNMSSATACVAVATWALESTLKKGNG